MQIEKRISSVIEYILQKVFSKIKGISIAHNIFRIYDTWK